MGMGSLIPALGPFINRY